MASGPPHSLLEWATKRCQKAVAGFWHSAQLNCPEFDAYSSRDKMVAVLVAVRCAILHSITQHGAKVESRNAQAFQRVAILSSSARGC